MFARRFIEGFTNPYRIEYECAAGDECAANLQSALDLLHFGVGGEDLRYRSLQKSLELHIKQRKRYEELKQMKWRSEDENDSIFSFSVYLAFKLDI